MSDMKILCVPLPGVKLVKLPCSSDERGDFLKPYNRDSCRDLSIDFEVSEYFITRSNAGVLRGMHFQVGEAAHAKLVTCISGRILDVIVDVRRDSPFFNQPYSLELAPSVGFSIYIAKGYAHGFYALENNSWVSYLTTKGYCPKDDKGVLWSSINFKWPTDSPCLSRRDQDHPMIGTEKCEFF